MVDVNLKVPALEELVDYAASGSVPPSRRSPPLRRPLQTLPDGHSEPAP